MPYSPLWAVVGLTIVAIALYDFYTTTVTVNGSGPISKRLSGRLWQVLLRVHRRRPSHQLLSIAGPVIMLVMILMWFLMCWLGWLLVFCTDPGTVINANTNAFASLAERVHYAGYTITTIGYGNFRAPNPVGQVASIIAGFNGLFLVTLAITYSIPVISAAVDKRQLALLINASGTSIAEIVDRGRGEGDFAVLAGDLEALNARIVSLSEQHLAYPVLHYFHDEAVEASLPLNLVRLDEAISIVLCSRTELPLQTRRALERTQRLIDRFLQVMKHSFSGTEDESPAPPDCSRIHAVGSSAAQIEELLSSSPRRKLLLAYIRDDGWAWRDVLAAPS